MKSPKKAPLRDSKPKIAAKAPISDRETISIRKIMNGYIIRKCRDTKDGYDQTEFYVDKRPEIDLPKGK